MDDNGNVYGVGTTDTATSPSGDVDSLIWSIYENGDQNFVQKVVGEGDDFFSSIVFNEEADSGFYIFGYSIDSPFDSDGIGNWVIFKIDSFGGN